MTERARLALLCAITSLVVVAVFGLVPPVPQPQWYHGFADRRVFLEIPNFLDVISNLPFVAVGLTALHQLVLGRIRFIAPVERWPYAVFFVGVALTGLTSAWYHGAPDDARLVGDRLTMTVAFMGWLAAQLAERVGPRFGIAMLPVLLVIGPASVLYWIASEAQGHGDLRAYGLVQFYPALLIPMLLWLFPPRYSRAGDVLVVIGLYALALCAEWLDAVILDLTGVFSGHTLKHLLAALAAYWVLRMLWRRQPAGSWKKKRTPERAGVNTQWP